MIYGHGDDLYRYNDIRIDVNFSSNIYIHTDHCGLKDHLAKLFHIVNSYPEPDGGSLARVISSLSGITESEVIATNGATEAIYLIANTFRNRNSAIVIPTFSEYQDACSLCDHDIRYITSLDEAGEKDEMIWLCNPNNPTGSVVENDNLEKVIKSMTDKIFIIDQSYSCFCLSGQLSHSKLCSLPNVISVNSLTKKYAVPGLRIGYIVTNQELALKLKKNCMPWSVNAVAIEAGKYLLNSKVLPFNLEELLEETVRFRSRLNEIIGITALPTNTHFFLCRMEKGNAAELKRYLIDKHSLLIRDASNFHGLSNKYFRVATQSKEENDLLIHAIKCWTKHYI